MTQPPQHTQESAQGHSFAEDGRYAVQRSM